MQQAADAMWAISTSFGPHTPGQWLALSQAMVRALPDGGLTLHYDPAIAVPFRTLTEESAAQGAGRAVAAVRHIRARDAAHARRRVGPAHARHGAGHDRGAARKARLVEFEGVGHAPTLIADNQVEAVASFLLGQCNDEKPDSGAT